MAVIVVGGGGRGVGKTALVCGLMRALPEIAWTAIKVTTHEHGKPTPIWEETEPGEGSDTGRYLAAGARRALLVRASEDALGPDDDTLGPIVQQVLREYMQADEIVRSEIRRSGADEAGESRAGESRAGESNDGAMRAGAIQSGVIPYGVIFESNSVLRHLRPDVCLCAATSPWMNEKSSYDLVAQRMDAMVELAGHDHIIEAEKITFRLASLERVSPTMQEWLRERLGAP